MTGDSVKRTAAGSPVASRPEGRGLQAEGCWPSFGRSAPGFKALAVLGLLAWLAAASAAAVLPGQTAADLVAEGNELFKKGDLEGALKKYTEAQALKPDAPELRFNIGDVKYSKGQFDEAAAEFRHLAQSGHPKLLPPVAYNLATAMAKQQQLDRAIELYKKAIQLDPKDPEARYNLGVLLEAQKQQQQQQQQSGQQKDQKDQKAQKDQKQGEQGKDPEKQQASKPEEGKEKEQKAQQPQPPKEQKPEQQAAAGQKQDEKDKKDQDKKPSSAIQGAIPREQAERLLDLLKEEEKQGAFLGEPGRRPDEPEPEKDW
ncbi:MAG: tetratricopeptide repeat protein [Candidatus Riflebacteria bacterium]|nr:tetratricopeptide repeat protein [Candidatus Riflebacteria bacterium]